MNVVQKTREVRRALKCYIDYYIDYVLYGRWDKHYKADKREQGIKWTGQESCIKIPVVNGHPIIHIDRDREPRYCLFDYRNENLYQPILKYRGFVISCLPRQNPCVGNNAILLNNDWYMGWDPSLKTNFLIYVGFGHKTWKEILEQIEFGRRVFKNICNDLFLATEALFDTVGYEYEHKLLYNNLEIEEERKFIMDGVFKGCYFTIDKIRGRYVASIREIDNETRYPLFEFNSHFRGRYRYPYAKTIPFLDCYYMICRRKKFRKYSENVNPGWLINWDPKLQVNSLALVFESKVSLNDAKSETYNAIQLFWMSKRMASNYNPNAEGMAVAYEKIIKKGENKNEKEGRIRCHNGW